MIEGDFVAHSFRGITGCLRDPRAKGLRARHALAVLLVLSLAACGGGRKAEEPKNQASKPAPTLVSGNPKFADSDPVEWPGVTPWRYAVHGVDVSRYQEGLDWHKLREQRISFGFIKATEGGDHTDPQFRTHWSQAAQAGIPRGAYHFYYFCRTPVEQARWFIRNVPKEANALPPVLDIEWNHQSRTCKVRPEPEVVRANMRKYLRQVQAHYGKTPLIYTTVDFFHENELWKVNGFPFWLRSVADHPSVVYPEQRWLFWQYTGTGWMPGAPGTIDLNVFHGSRAVWREWLVKNGVTTQ